MNLISRFINWIVSFFTTQKEDQIVVQTSRPCNIRKYKLTSEAWGRKEATRRADAEHRAKKVYRMKDRSLRFRSRQTAPPRGGIFLFNVHPE